MVKIKFKKIAWFHQAFNLDLLFNAALRIHMILGSYQFFDRSNSEVYECTLPFFKVNNYAMKNTVHPITNRNLNKKINNIFKIKINSVFL